MMGRSGVRKRGWSVRVVGTFLLALMISSVAATHSKSHDQANSQIVGMQGDIKQSRLHQVRDAKVKHNANADLTHRRYNGLKQHRLLGDGKYSSKNSRKLQNVEGGFRDFEDVISSLGDTTPMEWTGTQWLCLIILLVVISTIFSCLCGACCYRPRYGYGGRGGRGGGCLSDIFWCFCCFEWCCRDCQDVDACCDNYQGMQV